ncbi:MAG: ABC transporter ATP-binding protein [Gammaproteobacteria bacterium]|nr:ABC transporter ATP-binding protein [Gammaproteobacteria bacterium]
MQLAIHNLSKAYRAGTLALDHVSLTLKPGILGLLGPNGAGKSSLMRILATLTRPTEGQVSWNGVDIVAKPDALRRELGYLPQDFGVYSQLSAREFLHYLAAVKGVSARQAKSRIEELLTALNLEGAANRPLGGYSGGMRQRVGIAQALLNDPKLLIVDEPTVGLDPEERVRFRHLLTELSGERIVILSTHIVSDVEATAGQIAVINRGRLLSHGTPEGLLKAAEGQVWEVLVSDEAFQGLRREHKITASLRRRDGVLARVLSAHQPHPQAHGVAPSLEDAYLALINDHQGAPVSAKAAA